MSSSLLATKFFFPSLRENLIPRPRLVERLQVGLRGQLTLISAPAGSGKTTLLAEWHSGPGSRMPIAWLSLDKEDNDLSRFLIYLATALDTLKAGICASVLEILQSPQPPPPQVTLTALINDLIDALSTPFALVLDDYHVITSQPVHEAMTFLLDHLPPHMHLVLLTRADPPLPLASLRVHNQLTELRAADLRFTTDETAEFLNTGMGLKLPAEDIVALEERTEGWIGGLQLAALSMQDRDDVQDFVSAFTGSHHYIVDFLADEVLNNQPEPVRDFLLRTSILDQLTASLCNSLTDRSDGQTMLEKLENTNLFLVPLDNERCWYRYHHLFADMLHNRLQQTYPDEIPNMHRRAAEWFKNQNLYELALNHYLLINDFEQASRLVSKHWLLIWHQRTLSSSLTLMKKFPESMIQALPKLSLIYAWTLWSMGLRKEVEPYVLQAEQALSHRSNLVEKIYTPSEINAIQAETDAFRSLIATRHGDMQTAIEYASRAVKIAPADEFNTQGYAYVSLYNAYREMGWMEDAIQACTHAIKAARLGQNLLSTVDAIFNLGRLLKIQGELHRAAQVYWEGLNYAEEHGQAHLRSYSLIHFGLADVMYQWNNLDETERQLNLGFKLIEQNNVLLISMLGHITLAQLKRARGDRQGALQILQETEFEARKEEITAFVDEVMAYRVRLQAELGHFDEAVEWAKTIVISPDEKLGYLKEIQAIQLARVFIAIGSLDEALNLLNRIEQSAESGRNISWQIEALVLQSIIWQAKHGTDQANARIAKALRLAIPEDHIQIFLDMGEPMRGLIANFKSGIEKRLRTSQSEDLESLMHYTTKVLMAFPKPDLTTTIATIKNIQSELLEPLSQRELEVLRLVAEGKSNQQIAGILFISTGTVKKHLNNIFGKLGVQSRTQCVARGRELNLL